MATKDISVNGTIFPCPLGWTVEQAEGQIISDFVLQGGFIQADGIPQLGSELISNITGTLAFQPVQVQAGGRNLGDSTASLASPMVSSARKRRWDDLNLVLYDVVRKSKKKDKSSTPYSSIEWCDVEDIFGLKQWDLDPKQIEDGVVNKLHLQLLDCGKVLGTISSGKEAKRLQFIAPILTAVALLFKDDAEKVKILVEEEVGGVNIRSNGHFEFVLQKGTRKVCIVQATQEKMEKGMAQSLLGCEAIADVENVSVVYAVVTNFLQWYFIKYTDDHIYRNATTLGTINDIPTKESVGRIAGMLYALLTEE